MKTLVAVVLGLGLVSSGYATVVFDDHFDGTTLNPAIWTGSGVSMGYRIPYWEYEGRSAAGWVLIDGWDDWSQLTSVAATHPQAGQTVILSSPDISVAGWSYVSSVGFTNIHLEDTTVMDGHSWTMNIGGQKKTNLFSTNQMVGSFEITWSPTRVTATDRGNLIFDSDTMAPDGGGSWVIPTIDMHVFARNTYQGGVSFDALKLEVVPEPVSLALLGLGGLAFVRRK